MVHERRFCHAEQLCDILASLPRIYQLILDTVVVLSGPLGDRTQYRFRTDASKQRSMMRLTLYSPKLSRLLVAIPQSITDLLTAYSMVTVIRIHAPAFQLLLAVRTVH